MQTRFHSCVGLGVGAWLLPRFITLAFCLSSTHFFTTLRTCLGLPHPTITHLSRSQCGHTIDNLGVHLLHLLEVTWFGHFIAMGPICTGFLVYFCSLFAFGFPLVCVFLCSLSPCTFDGWVPVLDFHIQGFSSFFRSLIPSSPLMYHNRPFMKSNFY